MLNCWCIYFFSVYLLRFPLFSANMVSSSWFLVHVSQVTSWETWLAYSAEGSKLTLSSWVRRLRRPFDVLFLCFVYSETVTETLKLLFGMPRPHFFHTCRPNVDQVDCSAWELFDLPGKLICSRTVDTRQEKYSSNTMVSIINKLCLNNVSFTRIQNRYKYI